MKPFLSILAFALALCAPAAYAQTQSLPGDTLSDDDYEYVAELIDAGLTVNENCKSILDPKYYEGFKVLLHIDIGMLGGTDEDIKKADEGAVYLSNFVCKGKADCWRTALEMPETTTVEEGRSKCFSTISDLLVEIDSVLQPQSKAG